jgi:Fe-S cluster assembly iron-binding protein IscA
MIDDIKIVADKEFAFLFDDAKIVYTKGYFGSSFNVVTGSEGSCG